MDGLAPGTAPSAGSVPAGSGPGFPWPAERASGATTTPAICCPPNSAAAAALCALPAPRGTAAVAGGPASDGMADDETAEPDGETTRITAMEPPASASASADAASACLGLISTGERLEGTECRLGSFCRRLARGNYPLVTMSQPDSGQAGKGRQPGAFGAIAIGVIRGVPGI